MSNILGVLGQKLNPPLQSIPHFDRLHFGISKYIDVTELKKHAIVTFKKRWYSNGGRKYFRFTMNVARFDETALKLLATMPHIKLNGAEIATDMLHNEQWVRTAHGIFKRCLVQRQNDEELVMYNDTLYSKRRSHDTPKGYHVAARRSIVVYPRLSKIAGSYVLHCEIRLVGAQVLRDLGIHSVQDLLTLDKSKVLARIVRLFDITDDLGRMHCNSVEGKRRREARVHQCGKFAYDCDRSTANLLKRLFGFDEYGSDVGLVARFKKYYPHSSGSTNKPFLKQLDIEGWFRPMPTISMGTYPPYEATRCFDGVFFNTSLLPTDHG